MLYCIVIKYKTKTENENINFNANIISPIKASNYRNT